MDQSTPVEPVYCWNCKWRMFTQAHVAATYWCTAPQNRTGKLNLVTKEPELLVPQCTVQRSNLGDRCGSAGSWFEPIKLPTPLATHPTTLHAGITKLKSLVQKKKQISLEDL